MIRDNREYRSMPLLKEETNEYTVEGYASTFDEYELFDDGQNKFFERIEPHAFDETDMSDVVFLIDHEGRVYARTRNGSITVGADEKGLYNKVDLSRSSSSRALYEDIMCGNYDRMSFAFTVKEDDITRDERGYHRVIKSIGKLFDISAVSFPANPYTAIGKSARSAFDGFIEEEKRLELVKAEEARKLEELKQKFMEVKVMTEERRKSFSSELSEMTAAQVAERLASLEEEARSATQSDAVEEAIEMQQMLLERQKELEDLEQRKSDVKDIEEGAESRTIEAKEETKMERTFAVDTLEYRDAYMKSLMGKSMDIEERTALATAANVIPTETVNKIYGLLEENDLIKAISALHIPGYVSVPKATLANDANWVAMDQAATDSADTIGTVALSAYKLIKTIEITADIKAMSIPAFEGWLVNKLAQKMEAAICKGILVGAGSSEPTGLIPGASAVVTSMTTLAKFEKLMGKLGGAYHRNAVWVMSAAAYYETVMPFAADSNGILVQNGMEKMLLGHKVIIDDNCAVTSGSTTTQNVLFGNLNEGYVFNFGEGIAIEADGSVAFRSGSTVYRAMALCDGKPCDPNAVVLGTL